MANISWDLPQFDRYLSTLTVAREDGDWGKLRDEAKFTRKNDGSYAMVSTSGAVLGEFHGSHVQAQAKQADIWWAERQMSSGGGIAERESSTATLLERNARQQQGGDEHSSEREHEDEEGDGSEERQAKDARVRRFMSDWMRRIRCGETAEANLAEANLAASQSTSHDEQKAKAYLAPPESTPLDTQEGSKYMHSMITRGKRKASERAPSLRNRGNQKAEKSKPASSVSRPLGKQKALPKAQWVRCQNCGKWRALLRCMDASVFTRHGQQFYCLMNTWNESLASCSAPQENQYTVEMLFPPPESAHSESDHHDDHIDHLLDDDGYDYRYG